MYNSQHFWLFAHPEQGRTSTDPSFDGWQSKQKMADSADSYAKTATENAKNRDDTRRESILPVNKWCRVARAPRQVVGGMDGETW